MPSNNVNIEKLKVLIEAIKQDPQKGKITPKIVGDWIFEEGQPQFKSEIEVEGGRFTVEADMPTKLGGWGSRPGPLHWCLYGLTSCYAFTFAALATMENITLTRLTVEAESHVDFSKVFGQSENPIIQEVKFKVTANSKNATKEKLDQLRKQAEERCPAIYCLTKAVKVTTKLE